MKQRKVPVACPKCGHTQLEAPGAISTVCKKCYQHIRLDEAPAAVLQKSQPVLRDLRRVNCFQCGTELDVPLSAQSTMCKRCSSHVDLRDYQVTNAVSRNFKTKGRFVIEQGGYLFNTECVAGEAIIKGRLLGKLTADILELHSTAEIKGTFRAGRLVIPAGNQFRWRDPISVGGARIGGELVAKLCATGTVVLESSARMFGDIEAAGLKIEEGAIFVGRATIGLSARAEAPAKNKF
jgi:cytoskeletal protein CcmA (bactofilin family)/DNA-directed RNA polymerase subunit RPC12/RpoP